MTHQGSCLCGQVHYRLASDPLLTAVCHCRHCQKQSASAFSVVCAVPEADYEQTGATRVFEDMGESGLRVKRHFCPDCGSPILSLAEALPGVALIKAGTLDSFADLQPTAEVYCRNAVSWLTAIAGAERFPNSNL